MFFGRKFAERTLNSCSKWKFSSSSLNLKIGDIFSIKRRFTIEDVKQFSDLSGDKNPIHLDIEAGKNSIFKQRVVHGMLSASLFSNLIGNSLQGSIYMSQSLKFLAPIYIDEEVEATVEIKSIDPAKKRIILSTKIQKLEKGKLAIDGEAQILLKI